MTRSYCPQRITQPLPIVRPRHARDPAIDSVQFTCYRLVPAGDSLVAIELHYSPARMSVFVTR